MDVTRLLNDISLLVFACCVACFGVSSERARYKSHRVAQAFELAHFIRLTSRSPLVLLMVSDGLST